MGGQLKGKKIAFLAADAFEESELTKPWEALKKAGADLELVSLEEGKITALDEQNLKAAKSVKVDKTVEEANTADYDGLVLPGGVGNPDKLRADENAVNFVRGFFAEGKPVGAVCHGPHEIATHKRCQRSREPSVQDFHDPVTHKRCSEYASIEKHVGRSSRLTAEKVRQVTRDRCIRCVRKAKFG